jgi:hypothetical protein
MKKILKSVILILVLIHASQIAKTQDLQIDCSNFQVSDRAFRAVKLFITSSYYEDEREQVGIINEALEQIEVANDEEECLKLINLIANSPKYNKINQQTIGTNSTIYYYKTHNFYYIFWDKKPAFDSIPYTGPKTLFLVVKKDFSQIWEFYI